MLLADTGWTVYASVDSTPPKPIADVPYGTATHGYDNYDPLMQATFIAAGPASRMGVTAKPFDNIEVYGILACALSITPAQTDGDIKNVQGFMTKECG